MPGNKWWDGYNDEEAVILDDFPKDDGKGPYLGAFLKQWVDRYTFNAEIKGCVRAIRPKTIVITSNWHPREIWSDVGIIEPLMRRFHITKRETKVDEQFMAPPVEAPWPDHMNVSEWIEHARKKRRPNENTLTWDDIPDLQQSSVQHFIFP